MSNLISEPRFICSLESADVTVHLAGGKGVNLSRLRRAGFPVPPGFIVTTEAYIAFVRASGLADPIARFVAASSDRDTAAVEEASTEIRRRFARARVPSGIARAIETAYQALAAEQPKASSPESNAGLAVAVRSSATAEDSPLASFAGQHETYLNVRGTNALLEAVAS